MSTRTTVVKGYLTAAEYARVKRDAKRNDVSISTHVRHALLGKRKAHAGEASEFMLVGKGEAIRVDDASGTKGASPEPVVQADTQNAEQPELSTEVTHGN